MSKHCKKSNVAISYYNCAETYYNLHNMDATLECCNKAIELYPNCDVFYAMRCFIYARLKRKAEAWSEYQRMIVKGVFHPKVEQHLTYRWFGKMFLEENDYESAAMHFQKSVAKTTRSGSKAVSHSLAGVALYLKGDKKKCFHEFFTAFRLDRQEILKFIEIGLCV